MLICKYTQNYTQELDFEIYGKICVFICKYGMCIGFLCSKKRKWLEEVWRYWLEKAHSFEQQSDEGVDMDSQEELDHGVHSTDENMVSYCKKTD